MEKMDVRTNVSRDFTLTPCGCEDNLPKGKLDLSQTPPVD